jgi:hypothetical protein
MFNLSDNVKWWGKTILSILSWVVLAVALFLAYGKQQDEVLKLKDFKDGIQNHLVFDVKGRCYFVRPKDDVTVYLISVPDCDRK